MPTYSTEDFERIAAAIGVDPDDVVQCRNEFEAIAAWYRSDCRSPHRVPPSILKRQAEQIAAAAKRLLWHLEIYDYRKAHEGPSDLALLEALAMAEDGSEAEVIGLTERVGGLVAIFEGIAAIWEIERRGRAAASDAATVGKLTTLRGRRGNPPLRAWIKEMMPIYKRLTGKKPRVSVNDRGKPTGPFRRFLDAAGKPLGIDEKQLTSGLRENTRAGAKRASLQN